MCLYPQLIRNKKYTSNKKNGGVIPTVNDGRTLYVPIQCGNCIECRKKYAREWQVRLLEDIKTNEGGKFITLTFSNEQLAKVDKELIKPPYKAPEGYERDNAIATYAVRHFLERWRKKYGKSLRHFLITELGHKGTENVHLHGIVWTNKLTEVEKIWKYGFVWKGKPIRKKDNIVEYANYVNDRTIGYMTKYITKRDEKHKEYKSKILATPGIGAGYVESIDAKTNKFENEKTVETYRSKTGHKIGMPIYWRNKIYTEKEREYLWLNKLDLEVRWVDGQKISIAGGQEEYWQALKWAQRKNKKLGYGDATKDWSKKEYEKQRREMMINKRVENAKA